MSYSLFNIFMLVMSESNEIPEVVAVAEESDEYVPANSTSVVWKVFRLLYSKPGFARCKEKQCRSNNCSPYIELAYSESSTSNLLKHCRKYHSDKVCK